MRKVLRFLRTLEYSRKVVEAYKKIKGMKYKSELDLAITVLGGLSALFTVLFYATDHRVFLAEVNNFDNADWSYFEGQPSHQPAQILQVLDVGVHLRFGPGHRRNL